jgi:hypothetical protein
MSKKKQFSQFGLGCLWYKSKQDLIEELYIKSIVDTYGRLIKTVGIENDLRDRFIYDFYYESPLLKELIQSNILFVNWERWVFKNENNLGRTDLSFAISGFEYIVECKRLKNASQQYISQGLYRFIKNEYSSNESYAGMIGFVVEGNITNISDELKNKCITEEFNNNSFAKEKLKDWKFGFKTAHNRIDHKEINLHHLFFEFNLSAN